MAAPLTPDDLVELEQLKRLKYRYMRFIDQKLFDDLAELLTEDVTASYGGGAYQFEGKAAVMDFLRTSMASTAMLTSHRVHHPELDLESTTEATGVWAMEDVVVHGDFGMTIQGAGFYTDRYRKAEGTWLIAHTGYKRTYEELFPRASIDGLQLTAEWWRTEGRSSLG